MTNTVRSHDRRDLTENTIFGQGLTDPADFTFIQEQLANIGTGNPGQLGAITNMIHNGNVLPTNSPTDLTKSFGAGSTAVAVKSAPPTQTLYVTEPGETSAISYMDINQGIIGDCFLLSTIGELALFHPSSITSMIHANSNGTETVTMYTASNGSLPGFNTSAFKATTEVVNNSTFSPNGVNGIHSFSQDIVGNLQEIWPQVLETADATLNGGFSNISNGGYPVIAMEELTGMAASAVQINQMSWASLANDVQQGDLLQFDTMNAAGYGLVSGHSYMFKSINTQAQSVQLANPWGTQEPAAIPFSRLASAGIVEIDVGHAHS